MPAIEKQLGDGLRTLRSQIERKIAERQRRVERLRLEIKQLAAQRDACSVLIGTAAKGEGGVADEEKFVGADTISDRAIAVLSDPSVPKEGLHVGEIKRRMLSAGWETKAAKPELSITGQVTRDPRFERTQPNTFRLAKPLPELDEAMADGNDHEGKGEELPTLE